MANIFEEYIFNNSLFIRNNEDYFICRDTESSSYSIHSHEGIKIVTDFKKEEMQRVTRGEFYDTLKREIKEHCNFEKMQRIINND